MEVKCLLLVGETQEVIFNKVLCTATDLTCALGIVTHSFQERLSLPQDVDARLVLPIDFFE